MSLFADKWPSAFDSNPFGVDGFHSSSLGGFRWGSNVFGDRSDDDDFPSRMRIRNAPSLAERGFYDHFDSMFHDLQPLSSRRHFGLGTDDDFGRRSPPSNATKGKEHIIPIKIETSSSRPERQSSGCSSNKVGDEAHSSLNGYTDTHSTPLSGGGSGARGRVIHIPIVRETTSRSSPREISRSPPNFTPLIPTTDENRSTQRKSESGRRDDDVICLDSDAFFTQSRSTPRKYQTKYDSDVEIVDVEEKEEENSRSLHRKPLRNDANVTSSRNFTSHDEEEIRSLKRVSQSRYDAEWNDVRHEDEAAEREKSEGESKQSCAHPGVTNVTPPPSYPIYDHLRPRLASIGRQVDYIRGDGNCFFRALSKEMYGSEDYHAEWRQAVCDLIQQHPNVFQQYIDDSSVDKHVRKMRELGTWATTCEIYATASLLQREIYVLAPTPSASASRSLEYNWLLFSPRRLTGTSAGTSSSRLVVGGEGSHDELHPCYLTLCHTNGNHYDRIIPVFARCNCEMSPPSLNGVSLLLDLTASDEEELMQQ